jgi:plasmid maintenance system antidote protein VapI
MNRKLKAIIYEKFGSQAEFSMVVEEDESAISRIIRGRRKLNNDQRNRWARALGCTPNELLALIISSAEEFLK